MNRYGHTTYVLNYKQFYTCCYVTLNIMENIKNLEEALETAKIYIEKDGY